MKETNQFAVWNVRFCLVFPCFKHIFLHDKSVLLQNKQMISPSISLNLVTSRDLRILKLKFFCSVTEELWIIRQLRVSDIEINTLKVDISKNTKNTSK